AVAHECPFSFRKGVAHLDAFDEDPMAFLALVDRQDVVRPGIARLLHPLPDRRALLARAAHEAFLQHHTVAKTGKRGLDLVGIGAADDGAAMRREIAAGADDILDLADGVAGYRRQHVRAAECDPSRIVVDVVETRRGACREAEIVHPAPPKRYCLMKSEFW